MKTDSPVLLRITTVDMSLAKLLTGQMSYMKSRGFNVVMLSAATTFREEVIENEGCPHIVVPMERQIALWQDLKCLWLMYCEISRLNPDIVHTHTSKAGLLGMLAAFMAKVPVRIQTVAGTPPDADKSIIKKYIMYATEWLTFKAATHVWPNSQSLLDYIKEKKFTSPKKLEIIGFGSSNGVSLDRFDLPSLDVSMLSDIKVSIDFHADNIYFLFVGRLIFDKGIVELISAFQRVYKKDTKTRLLLVGSFEEHRGKMSEETCQIIKKHPGIIFVGWSNCVEYYMAIANYLVHPSYREGFPNVLLQAGAMKTPILASDVVGNQDCVIHKKTGLLFESRDAAAIEEALLFALDNPDLMKLCSRAWYETITTNFDRKKVHQCYYDRYCELIDSID